MSNGTAFGLLAFVTVAQSVLFALTIVQLNATRARCRRLEKQRNECLARWEGALATVRLAALTRAEPARSTSEPAPKNPPPSPTGDAE